MEASETSIQTMRLWSLEFWGQKADIIKVLQVGLPQVKHRCPDFQAYRHHTQAPDPSRNSSSSCGTNSFSFHHPQGQ